MNYETVIETRRQTLLLLLRCDTLSLGPHTNKHIFQSPNLLCHKNLVMEVRNESELRRISNRFIVSHRILSTEEWGPISTHAEKAGSQKRDCRKCAPRWPHRSPHRFPPNFHSSNPLSISSDYSPKPKPKPKPKPTKVPNLGFLTTPGQIVSSSVEQCCSSRRA